MTPGGASGEAGRAVGKQQYSVGFSQLDERTDMTSLNKDSTFEREDLSEMMSAGQKTQKSVAEKSDKTMDFNSRKGVSEMAKFANQAFVGKQELEV